MQFYLALREVIGSVVAYTGNPKYHYTASAIMVSEWIDYHNSDLSSSW